MSTFINVNDLDITFKVASNRLTDKVREGLVGGKISSSKSVARIEALRNINLNIKDGERVALIGHNGSGKTTLLKALSGVYSPSIGSIEVSGVVHSLINLGIGIDEDLSGYENALTKVRQYGIGASDVAGYVKDIETFAELGDFFYLPMKSYSAGMKARVLFAISTSVKPDILIMDEWIGAGDQSFKEKANNRIHKMAQESGILLIATHSASIIREWATRLIWMHKGEIIMDGDVAATLKAYQDSFNN